MRKLRQFCVAGLFTLVLTTATFAGDIETGGKPQPPPPAGSSPVTPGDIPTGGTQTSQPMTDSLGDLLLNLLQTMLSVF